MGPTLGRGLAAGAVATVFMSAVMLAGRRSGLLGRVPPEKITTRFLENLGFHPDRRQRAAAATFAHLAFGAAGGAGFAVVRRHGSRGSSVLQGIGWATGIWAVSYLGWVPALGILPRADHDRPGRPEVMVAAHWLYGAVLGLLLADRKSH